MPVHEYSADQTALTRNYFVVIRLILLNFKVCKIFTKILSKNLWIYKLYSLFHRRKVFIYPTLSGK